LSDLVIAAIEGYNSGLVDDEGEWDIFEFAKLLRQLYPDLHPEADAW
jgi:hypothetical protein